MRVPDAIEQHRQGSDAVMIGDTTFDIQMGRAAGVATIGVSWGYHAAESLKADKLITHFDALHAAVNDLLGEPA